MSEEDLELAVAGAKRLVKQALVATVLATLVAAIVLGIDMGIKRAVLDEVGNARRILDEFRRLADGATQADQAGAGHSGGVSASDGLVNDAGTPADADQDAVGGALEAVDRAFGVAGGAPGDG